jgi:hypothetical protein
MRKLLTLASAAAVAYVGDQDGEALDPLEAATSGRNEMDMPA